jgi:enoyl-CoA hydratase
MADAVLLDVTDRIATITLNRPEARNALNREVRRMLPAAVAEADGRDDVDVMILTGTDPAFTAGIDLKELAAGGGGDDPAATGAEPAVDAPVDYEYLRRGPLPAHVKPVIGAVNGVAVTGGFEVALACDFLVASDRARFADTHARVGIMPGWGLTVLLAQAVGVRRARELSSTGNYLDAETALSWGLVNHVVPHDDLLPFCRSLAADIVSNDQAGVRRIMQTYQEGSLVTAGEAWRIEAQASLDWRPGGIDPAEIERRRQAVVARGRSQVR